MKRFAIIIACITLALSVGCASTMNERPVAATNPTTGAVLLDKDGNPIVGTAKYNDEEANYRAQVDLAKTRKPVSGMEAAPKTVTELVYDAKGAVVEKKITETVEDIKISGVKRWDIWGRNGMEIALQRRISELEAIIKQFRGVLNDFKVPITVGIVSRNQDRPNNTFKDSFNNNQGNQSGTGRVNGGVSTTNVSGEGNTGSSSANPEDTSTSTSSNGGNSLLSGGTN